jgi:DNA-binding transcriptional MocR family regulator
VQAARLASLDQLKRVIYLGRFSKMLLPNIRVGFMAATAEIAETFGTQKLLTSLATPELDELRAPVFKQFEALGMTPFCRPQAGFLGWFGTGVDTITLAALALTLEAGYLLAPGALFSPQQTPGTWLRMNIATSQNPAMLRWLDKVLVQLRQQSPGS